MDNIKVVPYKVEHVKSIIKYGLNDKKIELDAKSYENHIDFTVAAMAFTLLASDKPVVCGGVYPLWPGVAEGWVISSRRIFDFSLSAAKAIKKRTDYICINNGVWRLQTAVRADYETGLRFASWLGLQKEGLMKKYGPDGSNYYRMAKIYELHR